jgi:hypothetical protein
VEKDPFCFYYTTVLESNEKTEPGKGKYIFSARTVAN